MQRTRGFTLIELLTVVAIIGVLATILIPTISNTRKNGYKIRCKGTLSDLGKAAAGYTQDEDGRIVFLARSTLPEDNSKPSEPAEFWASEIGPYLDLRPSSGNYVTMQQIMDKRLGDCITAFKNQKPTASNRFAFGVNGKLDVNADILLYQKDVKIPTKAMYMGEGNPTGGGWPIDLGSGGLRTEHRKDATNVLFVDTRVTSLVAGEFPPSEFDDGSNPDYPKRAFWKGY